LHVGFGVDPVKLDYQASGQNNQGGDDAGDSEFFGEFEQ